ncbi:MAG: SCO family protein [Sphingobacteriaceae bacterium]|nr:SCO family protein [Sphingobacteriaceae bacterium]
MIRFVIAITALVFFSCNTKTTEIKKLLLPVIGEKKLAGTDGKDTLYHTVQPFSFINQYHDTVSEKTIENKIYVADFFFATCQSICPKMSSQLVHVQNAFKNDNNVLILSHTVNPANDTVEVLNGYAQTYGAIKNKWHLLTGNKKTIYDMARYSYLVNALEDDGSAEGFLHSELFILVDAQKRIRGMYDGTDSVAVVKLISDIKLLKQE